MGNGAKRTLRTQEHSFVRIQGGSMLQPMVVVIFNYMMLFSKTLHSINAYHRKAKLGRAKQSIAQTLQMSHSNGWKCYIFASRNDVTVEQWNIFRWPSAKTIVRTLGAQKEHWNAEVLNFPFIKNIIISVRSSLAVISIWISSYDLIWTDLIWTSQGNWNVVYSHLSIK